MAYSVNVVRQDGFQLPSPAHTASPSDTAIDSPLPHPQAHTPTQNHTPPAASSSSDLFMPHNISFLPDSFRKFPSAAAVHSPHPNGSSNNGNNSGGNGVVDFSDELAGLIAPEHERGDPYRHNIFDISAPASAAHTHGMYQPPAQGQSPHDLHHQPTHAHFNSTLPALNSSMRYEPHPDPPQSQQGFSGYRHTPSPHGSRSRSRSVGPTRNGRRERRANSISSQSQAGASPPPQHQRPHPHAILIPGRSSSLGNSGWYGAYLPPGTGGEYGRGDYNGASARGPGGEYNLPTPESLTHSFGAFGPGQEYNGNGGGGGNNGWYAQAQGRVDTPGAGGMGVSPSQVSTMSPHVSSLGMHHLHNPNPNPHNPNHISHSLSHSLPLPLHPSIANAKYHHTHGHSLKSPTSPTSPTSPGSPSPPDSLLSPISSSLTATSPIANGLTPTTSTNGANASAGGASASTTNPGGNTLSEKRRRRRESHNAVERRRRDNINERIGELAGLIPGVLFECDAPLVVPSATSSSNTSNTNATSTSSTNPNTTNGNPQNPEELFALLPDGLGINDAISMSFGSSFGMGMNFGDMGVLPELPEEGMNMGMNIGMDMMGMGGVKADPSEDGHPSGNGNTTGGTGVGNGTGMGAGNGTAEPQTIKANKGMILRKVFQNQIRTTTSQ
ncbi:hypothetical protein BJ138DRAFT_740585 [Hygrophoropsis aurantiaca]|uniref:Uncharacterized protein n=1 Tax=Hygrophoropsis aurantiaca TaxID=72124 RepID=A0ACB8AHB6_9AGAM|nr:hypothetical protein BJ138DRAFT_740585 [Hygrophoropsis aurantiaca]